jgi:hypothetical protein
MRPGFNPQHCKKTKQARMEGKRRECWGVNIIKVPYEYI